jgi:hypothetical protein
VRYGWLIGEVWAGGWRGCSGDVGGGGAHKLDPERVKIDKGKVSEIGGVIHLDRARQDSIKQLRILDDYGHLETVVNITGVE